MIAMPGRRDFVFSSVVCVVILALLCNTSTGLKETFCEWRDVTLYCNPGTTLKINYATYGRDSVYVCCAWPFFTDKCGKQITSIIKLKCDGKGVCRFPVTNTELGSDPCPNVYKYITIDYECISGGAQFPRPTPTPPSPNTRKAVACEHQQLTLTCQQPQQRVKITKATYGRTDSATCPAGYYYSTNCVADVTTAVNIACLNRPSCVVTANNALAGNIDPCPGTYKYLTVEYTCV